jgi:aminomethyltransferase
MQMLKTALNDFHARMGAKLVDFAGWNMPLSYTSIIEEHHATRNNCTMFDVSHMGRVYVSGATACTLLDSLCTRDIASMEIGQSRYSHMCKEDGGILDDLIVSKFDDERFLVVCNASNRDKIVSWITRHAGDRNVKIDDQTRSTAMLAIQGPATLEISDELLPADLVNLRRYRFKIGKYMGVQYTCSRTGYTGEDGFEFILSNASGKLLADALVDPHGGVQGRITLAGLGARDTLRLEAGMPLYGHELHENVDSITAGQAWCVNLEKEFIGRDAIARIQDGGPKRMLVGLEIEGKRIARQDAPIEQDGRTIGEVTSGTSSPTLGRVIAMGFVDAPFSKPGTAITVDIRGVKTAAQIVQLPFFKKPKKSQCATRRSGDDRPLHKTGLTQKSEPRTQDS